MATRPYFLFNAQLHHLFYGATAILQSIARAGEEGASVSRLMHMGRPEAEVEACCEFLQKSGFLCRTECAERWRLTEGVGRLTLADLLLGCLDEIEEGENELPCPVPDWADKSGGSDPFLGQAWLSVHDSIVRQLRAYSFASLLARRLPASAGACAFVSWRKATVTGFSNSK